MRRYVRAGSRRSPSTPLRVDLVNVALATAVVILVIQAFRFVDLIRNVLLLLVLAIIIATGIDPIVTRLRRIGISRGPSILAIYLVIVGILAVFIVLLFSTASNEVNNLVESLPELLERLTEVIGSLPVGPLRNAGLALLASTSSEQISAALTSTFTAGTLSSVVFATLTVVETLFTILTIFVIAYFWSAERSLIRRLITRAIRPNQRQRALAIWDDVEDKLGAWVRGQIALMTLMGVIQGIGYAIFGLPFVVLLAVFAGLAELIPMVGPYIGAAPAVIVALTISPQTALFVIAYTVVVHLIEANVLVPRIMEQAVGLTPLTVILALLAGAALGGIVGALIAIPIAAAIQAAIIDLIATSRAMPTPPEAQAATED